MPTAPIDAETRASGAPVEDPDHDGFQRVKYAQRIAETLVKRRSQKSIVIGLYGKWGEGKSSVLHFIRRRLAESSEQVAVLNFNPWRFSGETQLHKSLLYVSLRNRAFPDCRRVLRCTSTLTVR